MRATSLIRFVVFGAVGFGIGGAIVGSAGLLNMMSVVLLGSLAIGLGGASLGMALKDWRKAAVLAVLGVMGSFFGVIVAGLVGGVIMVLEGRDQVWASTFYAESGFMAAVIGAVVGAALGLAFKDKRSVLALALAGFVGFGVAGALVYGIPDVLLEEVYNSALLFIVGGVVGAIGGASLGAALGYLEYRKLAAEQGPRVR